MISTTIFPGRYIQGFEAIQTLGKEASRFGHKALLILDPYVADHLFPTFKESLAGALEYQIERFTGEASDEEVERLGEVVSRSGNDIVIGVGGGKTLDTAKAVGYHSH